LKEDSKFYAKMADIQDDSANIYREFLAKGNYRRVLIGDKDSKFSFFLFISAQI
jgi:hypothetical protein